MPYTLWTLNAAQNLINQEILNNNFGGELFTTGDRSENNGKLNKKDKAALEKEAAHNIMPEKEYFIPIAAKCIGHRFSDKYLANINDNDIKSSIKSIRKYFYNIWKNDPNRANYKEEDIYLSFWKEGTGQAGISKMITKNDAGYYDILKESYDKTKKKNVLVGYSQGGLVARYLAWLDEKVFKENIIEGIITVQSPNYGSPLANSDNADNIIDLILTSFISVVSMYKNYFPILNRYITKGIEFENLKTVLEDIRADAEELLKKGNENAEWIHDFIISAQKWTSGLDKNICDTAFCDLNIKKMDEEYSILSSVNKENLSNIKYGAIVSSLNDFIEILWSIINELKKGKCIMKLIFNSMLKKKFILGKTFKENFDEVSINYKELMKETKIKEIKYKNPKIYEQGLSKNDEVFTIDKNLPELSHDFVIPTSYQLLENNKHDNFLGIYLNEKANHNSGGSLGLEAGMINSDLIIKHLKKFR